MLKKPKPIKKGGLGAQKVDRDFKKLEEEAQKADELQEKFEGKKISTNSCDVLSPEDTEEQIENINQAIEDLGERQKLKEQKLRSIDPKKADQMERLGMGFANIQTSTSTSNRSGVSHSAVCDMQIIQQNPTPSTKSSSKDIDSFASNRSRDPLGIERDMMMLELGLSSGSSSSRFKEITSFDDPYDSKISNRSRDLDAFEDLFHEQPKKDRKPQVIESIAPLEPDNHGRRGARRQEQTSSSSSNTSSSSSSVRRTGDTGSTGVTPAMEKFASAKAISSDQFFGHNRESDFETRATLSKFEGSSSISSDQYFGRNTERQSSSSSYSSAMSSANLDDIKEGVREGVTRVAGKLSSLASDVMSSINEKYGY